MEAPSHCDLAPIWRIEKDSAKVYELITCVWIITWTINLEIQMTYSDLSTLYHNDRYLNLNILLWPKTKHPTWLTSCISRSGVYTSTEVYVFFGCFRLLHTVDTHDVTTSLLVVTSARSQTQSDVTIQAQTLEVVWRHTYSAVAVVTDDVVELIVQKQFLTTETNTSLLSHLSTYAHSFRPTHYHILMSPNSFVSFRSSQLFTVCCSKCRVY